MADLVQTPANVGVGTSNSTLKNVRAGEAIVQGEPVYLHTDGKYYKADASVQATAAVVGIALTAAAADGYFVMQSAGSVNLGATLAVGELYVVSATAGKVAPFSDLATDDWVSVIGFASSTSLVLLQPSPKNIQAA